MFTYTNITKIANKLQPKLRSFELVFIILALLALSAKLSNIEIGTQLLVIFLSTLSIIYFLSGFITINKIKENALLVFFNRFNAWGLSILTIGILFIINHYPSSLQMLYMGTLTSLVSIVFSFYAKNKSEGMEQFYRISFIRNLAYGFVGILTILFFKGIISI